MDDGAREASHDREFLGLHDLLDVLAVRIADPLAKESHQADQRFGVVLQDGEQLVAPDEVGFGSRTGDCGRGPSSSTAISPNISPWPTLANTLRSPSETSAEISTSPDSTQKNPSPRAPWEKIT
jgi:hypothetical protein